MIRSAFKEMFCLNDSHDFLPEGASALKHHRMVERPLEVKTMSERVGVYKQ